MPIRPRRYRIIGRGAVLLAASAIAALIVAELTARLVYGVQKRHREADAILPVWRSPVGHARGA
jgi:hypothetical protein